MSGCAGERLQSMVRASARRPRLSIAITTGDMQDRNITTLSKEAEHPSREFADASIWMVSRRTVGLGGRHAPYRNAGHSGIDRETRQRPTARKLRRSDRKQHRPLCNRRPRGKPRPLSYSTVPAGMTRDIAHHRCKFGSEDVQASLCPCRRNRSPRVIVTGWPRRAPSRQVRLGKPDAAAAGA